MPAGKNTILVGAARSPFFANEWVIVSLQAGREYEARADLDSDVFRFAIVDVTSAPEITAYEFVVPNGGSGTQSERPRDLTLTLPP